MNFSITGNLVDIQNRPSLPQGGKVYAQPSLLGEICTNNDNFESVVSMLTLLVGAWGTSTQ